jgi:hypothetical protein
MERVTMSREVMFIIAVDVDTKKAYIDDATLTARFASNEQVWNTDTNEWESDDEHATLYAQALEILNNATLERE